MELWSELFSDWVGILSFGVIVFIIGMAIFLYKFFTSKMDEDEQNQA
jgi:hypothetical protein